LHLEEQIDFLEFNRRDGASGLPSLAVASSSLTSKTWGGRISLMQLSETEPGVQQLKVVKEVITPGGNTCIAWIDAETLVSAGDDAALHVWSSSNRYQNPVKTMRGHQHIVSSVAVDSQGRQFVSGSWDHGIRTWSEESQHAVQTHHHAHNDIVWEVTWQPGNSNVFASVSQDSAFKLWDLRAQAPNVLRGNAPLYSVAFSSKDANVFATGDGTGALKGYDARNLSETLWTERSHTASIRRIAFRDAAEGQQVVATAGDDGKVIVFDPSTKAITKTIDHGEFVRAISWDKSGGQLAVGGWNKKLQVFDI